MSNKNIFVFGGTGSIGKSLSKKLKSNNYDPIIISRNETELKQLSEALKVDFYGDPKETNPAKIYKSFEKDLEKYELIIVDTAGRSHIHTGLMNELSKMVRVIKTKFPSYTLRFLVK